MALNIEPGGESLADIGFIAEYAADARLLTELKLSGDILEYRGLGSLPFNFVAEVDAELAGNAYPVGITQHPVGLALLDRTVNRGGDAE